MCKKFNFIFYKPKMNGFGRIVSRYVKNFASFASDYSIEPITVPGTNILINRIKPKKNSKKNRRVVILIPGGPIWDLRSARTYGMFLTQTTNFKEADVYVIHSRTYINFYRLAILDYMAECISYIRSLYDNSSTFHLVGVSVGGMVVALYQAYGYNQADYYYHVASNINPVDFFDGINKTIYMKLYSASKRLMMRYYKCNTFDDRLVDYLKFLRVDEKLRSVDLSTTYVIFGEEDYISQNLRFNYRKLNVREIKEVKRGVHCCELLAEELSKSIC